MMATAVYFSLDFIPKRKNRYVFSVADESGCRDCALRKRSMQETVDFNPRSVIRLTG